MCFLLDAPFDPNEVNNLAFTIYANECEEAEQKDEEQSSD